MAIKGAAKEKLSKGYTKYVGMFNATVAAVNPTKEQLEKLLNTTLEKDLEYTGVNDENGAKKLAVSIWLKESKTGHYFNVRFNLEDTVVKSKNENTQYINSIGECSYAATVDQLPSFIKDGKEVRIAKRGEELLYKFMKNWLKPVIDFSDPNLEFDLEWRKLISGKVGVIQDAIDRYANQEICAMATIRMATDGKEYQSVYSYEFLPDYALGCFNGNGKSYANNFIAKVNDPNYGCKDYYELKPMSEYDPTKNVVVNSNSPILNQKATSNATTFSHAEAIDDLPF